MKSLVIEPGGFNVGQSVKIAVFSDPHFEIYGDNRDVLADMRKAYEDCDRMYLNGDIADWIYHADKRYTNEKAQKRNPEAKSVDDEEESPIDIAVKWLTKTLEPFADKIDFIMYGNHETVARDKYLTDPIRRVCEGLGVKHGAYRALVTYRWRRTSKKQSAKGCGTRTLDIYTHHGGRGVAVKNKGVLALSDMMGAAEADVYVVGHGARGILDPGDPRIYRTQTDSLILKNRKGMQVPGYHNKKGAGVGFPDKFYKETPQGYGIIQVTFTNDHYEVDLAVKIKTRMAA